MEIDRWAYVNQVILDFSRPGKLTDKPCVESLNGKNSDECLSVNWFLSLQYAQKILDHWKWEYNTSRPNFKFVDLTPDA